MKTPNARTLGTGAAILVAVIAVLASTYTVTSGQVGLVLRGNAVTAVQKQPGLHWKWPLVDSIVLLDSRLRLETGSFPKVKDKSGVSLAYRYSFGWKISNPKVYYGVTNGNPAVVANRMQTILTKAASKIGWTDPKEIDFAKVEKKLQKDIHPLVNKLGIDLADFYVVASGPEVTTARPSTSVNSGIGTGPTSKDHGRKSISAETRVEQRRQEILDAAHVAAARIEAQSEAHIATLYAPAERLDPEFFRFYLPLQMEREALLNGDTRVMVVSTASPWFKALNQNGRTASKQ